MQPGLTCWIEAGSGGWRDRRSERRLQEAGRDRKAGRQVGRAWSEGGREEGIYERGRQAGR